MSKNLCAYLAAAVMLTAAGLCLANEERSATDELHWYTDYREAYDAARNEEKMLLLHFTASRPSSAQQAVEQKIATDAAVRARLADFVLVRLPVDAAISIKGNQTRLLRHPAFAEMHGLQGIAIIDLAHQGEDYYGRVVSAFPYMIGKYYRFRASYLPTVLNLPPGTITQRSMIWAVRIHPENPASTHGIHDPVLVAEARQQSLYQARIGVQGHHRWEGRFHRIRRLLGGRGTPVEVVAESWPSQTMIDSCIDCVASWRHSSGHWSAVKARQASYGYDIRKGGNGIWYGTGIFTK